MERRQFIRVFGGGVAGLTLLDPTVVWLNRLGQFD